MEVVKKNPVPIYQLDCQECGSTIRYKATEIHNLHITCPVCGVSNWANAMKPVAMEDEQ